MSNGVIESGILSGVLPADPLPVAADWLREATELAAQPNPNSMAIATTDERGRPSVRAVLCKAFRADPGYVVFFTNYRSRKGTEIADGGQVAGLFHWDHLGRQVRIEGPVTKSPDAESDAYFASRPWQSQIGAWASDQSAPVESREVLLERIRQRAADFGTDDPTRDDARAPDSPIARPPHWGGYRLWAERVELWVAGFARVHDRALWERTLTPDGHANFSGGPWRVARLQP